MSTQTNNKAGGALAIIEKDGLILSISRKHDHNDLGLPGGKIEPGETPEQAVIREVQEEVGLKGINPRMIDQRKYHDRDVYCFVFESVEGWENLTLGATDEGFITFATKEELCKSCHSYHDYNQIMFNL